MPKLDAYVHQSSTNPAPPEVTTAVDAFNRRFGRMDKVVWTISNATQSCLLANSQPELTAEFVWLIRSWMGVQGPSHAVKTIAASVLHEMKWRPSDFEPVSDYSPAALSHAVQLVHGFATRMKQAGAPRYEFSLASKVLHWLCPWRIPVYDSYVREVVAVPQSAHPKDAYQQIAQWEYGAAAILMAQDSAWLGDLEPRSPLHAIDKYLWWSGGGDQGNAVVVKDPERILRRLGLASG